MYAELKIICVGTFFCPKQLADRKWYAFKVIFPVPIIFPGIKVNLVISPYISTDNLLRLIGLVLYAMFVQLMKTELPISVEIYGPILT